jgi:hypothetical protein
MRIVSVDTNSAVFPLLFRSSTAIRVTAVMVFSTFISCPIISCVVFIFSVSA